MNNLIETNPEPPGLLLHCGAKRVTRLEVLKTPTPQHTRTWYPLPHSDLIDQVEEQLESAGFEITSQVHALSHGDQRYFGVLQVETSKREHNDYSWVVGLRNSHDKSYPAGLVAGSRVFCCDNLAFTGEVRISRKHTRFAVRDLRHLTSRAVGQLGARFRKLDERIDRYRDCTLNDKQAHDVVIRALDCGAVTASKVPDVLKEWRTPTYQQFTPRNAWALFNAMTETHKSLSPGLVLARTEALHGLFDGLVGLN